MKQMCDKFLITQQGIEFRKSLSTQKIEPVHKQSLLNSVLLSMNQSTANLSQYEQDLQKLHKPSQIENHLKCELSQQNNDSIYVNRLISEASGKIIKARGQAFKQLQLPVLDFRQREILKNGKYHNCDALSMKNSILVQQGQDDVGKMVAATLYQIEKIDRIVKKYSLAHPKRNPRIQSHLFDEVKDPKEEMLTLRNQYSNEIRSLNKNEEYQDRYKLLIKEIHAKTYKKKWKNVHVPKQAQK